MSAMFRGQFEHAIDAKGRTSLPSRYRDVLAAGNDLRLVLTRALFDRCLHLYPMKAWEELEAKIAEMPQFDPNVVAFRRLYLSAAVECELDKQGRILIPPSLRDHAELEKDVLWAGMGRTAELWSKERWQSAQAMSEVELAELQDRDRGAVPPMNVENIVPMRLPPPRRVPAPSRTSRCSATRSWRRSRRRRAASTSTRRSARGGHTRGASSRSPATRVDRVDRDESRSALARARLARFGDRVTLRARALRRRRGAPRARSASRRVDGLFADLGVSSMQLDDAARGMSFRAEGPLDMRMDPSAGETALELIDRLDDDELADVIYQYGEERRSRRVARCIKQALATGRARRRRSICAAPSCARSARRASAASIRRRARSRRCASR